MRRDGWLKVLTVNFLILVIGVVVMELLLGDWFLDNRLFFTRIPRDLQIRFDVSDLYEREPPWVLYTRDKSGLRGDYRSLDSIDILTVGGSTTDQRYIDDSETWQEVMKREIEMVTGENLSVVNAGIDGQTSFGHLANFDHWFAFLGKLRPRFILFYVGLNDIHKRYPNEGYDDLIEPVVETGWRATLKTYVKRSAFYNAWINFFGYIQRSGRVGHRRLDFSQVAWTDVSLPEENAGASGIFTEDYSNRLRELAARARALGAQPVFVNQLTLRERRRDGQLISPMGETQMEILARYRVIRAYAQATIESCEVSRGICIDLFDALGPKIEADDFYDWAHNTPKGAQRIGRYLGKQLAGPVTE